LQLAKEFGNPTLGLFKSSIYTKIDITRLVNENIEWQIIQKEGDMSDQNNSLKHISFVFAMIFFITAVACNAAQIVATPAISTLTPDTITLDDTSTPNARPFVPGDPTATPLGTDITDPNFIKGVAAFDAKNCEETISFMSAAIQANPNLAPPYRYRGLSYWYLKDCSSALADFERAVSINPNYAAAWAGRGLANSCFENWDQALEDYQKALAIDPSLAFIHHNLGVYYYGQGDYERSLEEYSLSVAIDPNRSGGWGGKAEALLQLGQNRDCITNATKAIEINTEEWLAYKPRAYCEDTLGDHLAAIEDYKVFLAHDATDPKTWYNLGFAQYNVSLHQEAVDSYSKALELDPSYYPAYINRGLAYIELEKFNEALNDYNRALEFGDIGPAYSGRGDAYRGLKMYDLAIADYQKAISLMPDRPHSYCMLAYTYFEVGKYQDSLEAAKKTTELDPSCGGQRLLEYQARSYYALGDYEQAILYMNKAFQMGEYSLGYYYRGIIYDDAGKYEHALSDLNYFIMLVRDETTFAKEIADAKARIAELTP
jgi:tetratricopeptide (TPR) repeat protein